MTEITFGVLTVSDSCHAGLKEDFSGPKLCSLIKEYFPSSKILAQGFVPDIEIMIIQTLKKWCSENINIILTTGGTGFSPRDVTPEATRAVICREAPAITTTMTMKSLEVTPMAMLSRSICGIRNKTIIINLPGSAKGAAECFGFVKDVLKHAVDLLLDNQMNIQATHEIVQNPFEGSKVKMNCVAQRNRKSSYPMISVIEAQNIIFNEIIGVETEEIDITCSLNRVLAEDIYSHDALPPFPASIKDGYAVIAADGAGIRLVRNCVAAGDKPDMEPLKSGEIVRISTGAPVPLGADAVVQVEDTELIEHSEDWSKEIKVEIKITPTVGLDIRPVGSDIPKDCKILLADQRITAAHIGVFAAVGQTKIQVYKQLSIGVISTGNELQNPHETIKPGHIRDSNKLTLINLLNQYSYCANDCGIAEDNPDAVKRMIIKALIDHDVVVTTGGVSMGEFDVVKQVLITDFDANIHFGRVNMKPGKPTTFATCVFNGRRKYIFALPGNPVSATVTTILFVIPALRRYEKQDFNMQIAKVILAKNVNLDPRPEYMRAHVESITQDGRYVVNPTGNQISSRLNSFVGANFLICLPGSTENIKSLTAGTIVDAIRINHLI